MKNFDPTLLSFFQDHNLSYEYFEHPPIFTVEEGEVLKQSLPGKQTKNLFLTDKRGQYRLVCIESSKRLQINQFRKLVGAKDMTFATAEEMKSLLHLIPGSVSIFGLLSLLSKEGWGGSDSISMIPPAPLKRGIFLYIDQDLWESDLVGRHPNRNDATIVIDHETLVRFLNILYISANILEIGEEIKLM